MVRTRWAPLVFPVGMATVALLGWWLLQRHTVVQGDDFPSAALGGARGGRFTLQAWWHQAVHDWWAATGRQSGTVFRVFQRAGVGVTHVVMALVQVALALVLAGWSQARRRGTAGVLLGLLAFASVPTVLLFAPRINGDAVFWMLSSFDYVFSPMLALAAGLQLARLGDGDRVRVGWFPVLLFAPVLHETSSAALLVVAVAAVLVRRGRLTRSGWVAVALVLAGCAFQMSAPGLWKRLGTFNGLLAESGAALRLHQSADAMGTLYGLGRVELLVLALVLAFACWTLRAHTVSRIASLGTVVAALVGWPLAAHFTGRPGIASYTHRLTGGEQRLALGVALAGAAALLLLLLTTWAGRRRLGDRPLLATLGLGGSFGPTLLTGVTTPRAYLPMLLWLCCLLGCLCSRLLDDTLGRRPGTAVTAVLAAAALACGLGWTVRAHRALVANEHVHTRLVAQMTAARHAGRGTVVFPHTWPAPDYQYANAFLLSRYGNDIKLYYDLPAAVRLVRHR